MKHTNPGQGQQARLADWTALEEKAEANPMDMTMDEWERLEGYSMGFGLQQEALAGQQVDSLVSREAAQREAQRLRIEIREVRASLFHDDEAIEQANIKRLESLRSKYLAITRQLNDEELGYVVI